LTDLVKQTNVYMQYCMDSKYQPRAPLLKNIGDYVTHLFRVFGLIDSVDTLGFTVGGEGADYASNVKPFVSTLCTFREEVRVIAREHKVGSLLNLCDKLRDETLPLLGVKLEDKPNGAIWDLGDKEALRKEVMLRLEEKEKKEQQKRELEAKKAREEAQSKIPANEWFKSDVFAQTQDPKTRIVYTKFDDKGIPTHFLDEKKEEVPIGKGQQKKLEQAYAKQQKLHETWLKKSQEQQQAKK